MDLTTATPVQIDTEISRIDGLANVQYALFEKATKALDSKYATERTRAQAEKVLDEVKLALDLLRVEAGPFHAEFTRRGGWARYYLVEGGHVHFDISSYRCSRIVSTPHYWLVDQSGMDAEELIELAGERVCTTCFPDAPVAVQNRPSLLLTKTEKGKAAERDVRTAKRDQAAKDKAAKAITAADGSELRVPSTYGVIKTERAAAIELVDCLWYEKFYSTDDERVVSIERLTAALAHKRGTTPADELAAGQVRLAARIKREG